MSRRLQLTESTWQATKQALNPKPLIFFRLQPFKVQSPTKISKKRRLYPDETLLSLVPARCSNLLQPFLKTVAC